MSQQPYVQLTAETQTAGQPSAESAAVASQQQSVTDQQNQMAALQPQAGTSFGQLQMLYGHTPPPGMQLFIQPAPQAISCVPIQPPAQQLVVALPKSLQPYSFLVLSITVTIVCSILNLTALAFGIPAIVLSLLSEERKRSQQYEHAKRFGATALALNIVNITYTFVIITLAIGLGLGLALQECYDYNYC